MSSSQCLLYSDRPKLVKFAVLFWEHPGYRGVSINPGIRTSTSLVSVHAILDFLRNAHSIIVGRSSPGSARVSAPSDREKCVVNTVSFPAVLASRAFGISGADMGVFPLIDVPTFGRGRSSGKRTPPSYSSLAQTSLMGHVALHLVPFSTVMR